MDMMKSYGESSSRGREDGDATTGSERPLKKARFAWQVKGKYHIKSDTDDSNKNLNRAPVEPLSIETTSTSQGPLNTLESNIESYLVQQEYNKLDSAENPEHARLFTPINNLNTEQFQYPRYASSFERTSYVRRSNASYSFRSLLEEDTEDQYITHWQEKQVLNGCVDNILNQVLESWSHSHGDNVHSQCMTRDFAEFINHMPGDNSVENEGILMAISAHGLQNTSSSSSNSTRSVDHGTISNTHVSDISSPLSSVSPAIVSDEDNYVQKSEDGNKQVNPSNEVPNWHSGSQNAPNSTPFQYFSEPSQSPDFIQNLNTDSFEIDNNLDFMNAAVLFAIKNKGLTASVTEYG